MYFIRIYKVKNLNAIKLVVAEEIYNHFNKTEKKNKGERLLAHSYSFFCL